MIRKHTAQQRPCHARNTPHTSNQTKRQRPLSQRECIRQDDNRAREQSRCAHPSNRSPHDKSRRRRRYRADQTTQLEDGHSDQKHCLDAEATVQLAVQRLQRRGGQQVRAAIPANVLGAAELRGDGTQGGRDDGLVQGDEENGQAEGGDD